MEIDFQNNQSHILINPRLPKDTPLPNVQLPGHVWIATSGTTGSIKWAALSKNALLISAQSVNAHFLLSERDVWLNPLPLFHVGGLGIHARASLTGSQVIPYGKWEPQSFVDILRDSRSTITSLVPTQLFDLVHAGYSAPATLRAVIIGGGYVAPLLFEKALKLNWPVAPSYGMTECCSQVATALPGQYSMNILPHVALKDNPLKIASKSLLTAYWKEGVFYDPKEGEWLQTEDLVEIKGNQLSFLGRKGDWAKILGENVHLLPLQSLLDQLAKPQSVEAYLKFLPDPRKGSRIVLVTTCQHADSLTAQFNSQVMPYERIDECLYVPNIEKTALGKVIKHS